MFVSSKQLFDKYCQFLFDILFKVEENLKQNNIGGVAPREMGYFSEWLLNVWVRKNKLKVAYQPITLIEEKKNWHYRVKYLMQQHGMGKLVMKIENFISDWKEL